MTPSYLDLAYRTLAPENPARQAFQALDPNQDGVLTGEERAGLDGAGRARTTALTAEFPIRDLLAVVGKSDTAKKSWLGVNDRNTFFQDTAEALGWSDAAAGLRARALIKALNTELSSYEVGSSLDATLVRPATTNEIEAAAARGMAPGAGATLVTAENPVNGRKVVIEIWPERLLEPVEVMDRRSGGTITGYVASHDRTAIGNMRVVAVGDPSKAKGDWVVANWAEAHLRDAMSMASSGQLTLAADQVAEGDAIVAPVDLPQRTAAVYKTLRELTLDVIARMAAAVAG